MKPHVDPRIVELYDAYCHSTMARRDFLARAAATVAGGLAMAEALLPDYALACQVGFNDERISAEYARFPSPGGNGGDLRAYVARPKAGDGLLPTVLVVHENRGLNPYVEDVARRLAVAGYLAVAPDALWPVGGYPGNDDQGKVLQAGLDRDRILVDLANAARFAKAHPRSNGKLGVTGFCFGGYVTNHLAVTLGAEVQAAAPFYGRAPDVASVGAIRARLVLHYAEHDDGVNATRADYEAALTKAGVAFASHTYAGTQHGFHNDSTPRYDQASAELAWRRTLELFAATLAA